MNCESKWIKINSSDSFASEVNQNESESNYYNKMIRPSESQIKKDLANQKKILDLSTSKEGSICWEKFYHNNWS